MTGDGKDAVQGKAILGGRNPPSLLPVPRSGVSETHRSAQQCWCRLGWHVCGSTAALAVGMLPTPVSPSPCGDATDRHGQHRHQPRQAVGEGAQRAAALKKEEEQREEENAKLAQWVDLLFKCS